MAERESNRSERPPGSGDEVVDGPGVVDEVDAGDGAAHGDAGDVVRDAMRARLKQKLFGVRPSEVKLGRFVILDRLGQGGNGIVYIAYDPELDRRVAVKLLNQHGQGEKARTRLLREAQALARLSHPNVVPVYDVGVIDDRVFIVMEFVSGQTLRAWVAAEDRPWREIWAAYEQAGRGLAAAHEVGLVHRDFKPDNVQVGDDGRVRVLDFGLVRGLHRGDGGESSGIRSLDIGDRAATAAPGHDADRDADHDDDHDADDGPLALRSTILDARMSDGEPIERDDEADRPEDPSDGERASAAGQLAIALTRPGDVLGTPAYMSPEQIAGLEVGPTGDQFSFCQAMYESLYRQSAYGGKNLAERNYEIKCGNVRPPPRDSRVPRRVFPILRRGLAPEPEERYPSMDALLGALGHDPGRARVRWAVALSFIVLAGFAAYSLLGESSPAVDPCQGGEGKIAEVWGAEHRGAVRDALLSTGLAYADDAWPRVDARLTAYGESWAGMYREACLAHQRGDQSGILLDRRMACLERRREALASAVEILAETDARSLDRVVDLVQKLPVMTYCANADALVAEVAPPEDPAVAQQVAALRQDLSRVKALEDAGRYDDAIERGEVVVRRAQELGYRPFLASALLAQGRAFMGMANNREAVGLLRRATVLGLATRANDVALEALARRIYAEGVAEQKPEITLANLDVAEALIERVPDPTFVHALLLNNAGVVHMVAGDREQAREYFRRALEIRNQAPDLHVELNGVLLNLALVTPEPGPREGLLRSATRASEEQLGLAHPQTLSWRRVRSVYTLDPREVRGNLVSTCALYQRHHPGLSQSLSDCLFHLGFAEAELGNPQQAAEYALQAATIVARAEIDTDDRAGWFPELARGYSLLYRGDPRAALIEFDRAVAVVRTRAGWWTKERLAQSLLGLGESLVAMERHGDALPALEEAHAEFLTLAGMNERVETRRYLARSRLALATALWASDVTGQTGDAVRRAQQQRAIELIGEAEKLYRLDPSGFERRLQEIAVWREARDLGPVIR